MAKQDKPAKQPGKSLDDLLAERYPDEALRQRVKEDIVARGTEKQILRGELKLPSLQDAEAHYKRIDALQAEEDE